MTVLVFVVLIAAAAAQNMEEQVVDIVDAFWDKIEKVNEGYVDNDDFVNFFSRYDNETSGEINPLFFVDEEEFAVGWAGDFPGTSDDIARALFKSFDTSRYETKLLPEGITVLDTLDFIYYFDVVDYDGSLSEAEFKLGFIMLQNPLLWATMFIRYRETIAVPSDYDDAVYTEQWQTLFDDIDADGDELCTSDEFERFVVDNNYGFNSTAQAWFAVSDVTEDGVVDRVVDWTYMFSNLDYGEPELGISFKDFIWLDRMVRG